MIIYKILNNYVGVAKINNKKFYFNGSTRLEVIQNILTAYQLNK